MQYTYKCLERGRLSANLEEFLSYDDFTERSYSRLVMFLLLANKYKGTLNERYYLQRIVEALLLQQKQQFKPTFSCDYKRLESTVSLQRQVCSFFGVYDSPEVLLNECQLRLEQLDLLNDQFEGRPTELLEVPFDMLLDFSRFEFLREGYRYQPTKSIEEALLERSLTCTKLLQQLQLRINSIARAVLTKQEVDPVKGPEEAGRLKIYSAQLLTQLQAFRKDPR